MMDNSQVQALAAKIFPGFGAFGPDRTTCLSVPVGMVVDQVVIAITAPAPEHLNLYAPSFFDAAGNEIAKEDIYSSVKMSSLQRGGATDTLNRAVNGAMLHSGLELCPTLVIKLKKPVFVSKITIANRQDIYHSRSRYLTIRAFEKGRCCLSYDSADPARMVDALLRLTGQLNVILPDDPDAFDCEHLASTIRAAIQMQADNGTLHLSLRQLCMLLPMFDGPADPDDYQEAICAYMVIAHLGARTYNGTKDLRLIAQFLQSGAVIDRVRARACQISEKKFGVRRAVTLSKHQVHYARLVERRDAHLDGMDKAFALFRELGIPLMLCYGTLLGAVRSESFIAHDDDVDLLYFDGSRSQGEMRAKQLELADRISACGFRTDKGLSGINFHIYTNGVSLDLFPSWIEGDRLNLLMEQLRYRDIPASMVLGENAVNLHGRSYAAPANPEAFLGERYGETWRIPNAYHEWPWKVKKLEVA